MFDNIYPGNAIKFALVLSQEIKYIGYKHTLQAQRMSGFNLFRTYINPGGMQISVFPQEHEPLPIATSDIQDFAIGGFWN